MTQPLVAALEMTVVGMALVFGSLIVFWLVMLVLVRVTADRPEETPAEPAGSNERALKARAAAAAVALALALPSRVQPSHLPLAPDSHLSPWQAATRASQLRQRGRTR